MLYICIYLINKAITFTISVIFSKLYYLTATLFIQRCGFLILNNKKNMNKNIFLPRVNILPYEYPQLLAYKDAIRHSYWIDTEFNFTEDIQDFKVTITPAERDVIKKTMLAIAQIEVNVKTFWGDLYKRMPITEVGDVGFTFAESEVRHKDAYAKLLRILGLEKEFQSVIEVPAIECRLKYLKKYLDGTRSRDNKMYTKSVLLFSLFI